MKRTPIKRTPPRWRMPIPEEALEAAVERAGGPWCIVCNDLAEDPHHVLPVQGWPQHCQESLNLVPICRKCHANHHAAHRRIRLEELPAEVREWATMRADWYMAKTYTRRGGAIDTGEGPLFPNEDAP